MKIIILGTAYPYRGGLATFNERLARQFRLEGHEVIIHTFTLQYPSFLFPGKTQYSQEAAPTDLHIQRTLNSCNPFNWIRLGRKLRRERPDMLISCYWMSFMAPAFGMVSRIVSGNGHTRCIALVHNMLPHEPSLMDKLFSPYFVGSQQGFVALSDSVVRDIDKLDKNHRPKTFSPHPIYDHYGARLSKLEACASLCIDPEQPYILFFGLVRAYKGLDLLIEAMGLLKRNGQTVPTLIIAGEFYEDELKYRTLIEEQGIQSHIILRNEFIADSELPNYFGAADLIVQPYKSATQSGVTQVAFHFEKPMLVTNVGGLGEIVHNGKMGYAVAPDPQAIANAINDYFTQHRQEAFTAYLRNEKSKYDWDKMTAAFTRIYSQS